MDYSIEDKSNWAITALQYKGHLAPIHRSPSPPGGWGCRVRKGFDSYRIDGAKTVFELEKSFHEWVDAGMPSAAEQLAEISKKESARNHAEG
jgi:hypothetical protein